MSIPVHSPLRAEVTVLDNIAAVIEEADLNIPLNKLNFEVKSKESHSSSSLNTEIETP